MGWSRKLVRLEQKAGYRLERGRRRPARASQAGERRPRGVEWRDRRAGWPWGCAAWPRARQMSEFQWFMRGQYCTHWYIEPGAWPSWCSVRVGDVLVVGSSSAGAVCSRAATRARGCAAASATEATGASRGESSAARLTFSLGSVRGRVRRRPAGRNSLKPPHRPRRWECHGGGHWRALLSTWVRVFFALSARSARPPSVAGCHVRAVGCLRERLCVLVGALFEGRIA